MDDSTREAVATFRFSLNAPIVTRKLGKGERQRILKEIPTDCIFPSKAHQELTARLQFVIENRLFSLFTGDIGAGKSTAIRTLANSMDPSKLYPSSLFPPNERL